MFRLREKTDWATIEMAESNISSHLVLSLMMVLIVGVIVVSITGLLFSFLGFSVELPLSSEVNWYSLQL